nr:MAG TPA: hypothetical protein [Caudoviricetes sp.]
MNASMKRVRSRRFASATSKNSSNSSSCSVILPRSHRDTVHCGAPQTRSPNSVCVIRRSPRRIALLIMIVLSHDYMHDYMHAWYVRSNVGITRQTHIPHTRVYHKKQKTTKRKEPP